MNDVSITECSVMRGRVHKHGYGHKQATAAPSVAGVSEAGDCVGNVAAGLVGIAGGATLRRERQSGFRLAAALSRTAAKPTELRLLPVTVTPDQPEEMAPAGASELIEIVLTGGYRPRIGEGVQASTLRLVLDVLERR